MSTEENIYLGPENRPLFRKIVQEPHCVKVQSETTSLPKTSNSGPTRERPKPKKRAQGEKCADNDKSSLKGEDQQSKRKPRDISCRKKPCLDKKCQFRHNLKVYSKICNVDVHIENYLNFDKTESARFNISLCEPSVHDTFRKLEYSYVNLPSLKVMGVSLPKKQNVLIFDVLYHYFTYHLKTLSEEARNYTAICKFAMRFFVFLDAPLIHNHIHFYLFKNHDKVSKSTVGDLSIGKVLLIPINVGAQKIIPFSMSIKPTYNYNGNWTFVKSKGFEFETQLHRTVQGDVYQVVIYPKFNTLGKKLDTQDPVQNRGCRREFFRFKPYNEFQVYQNCSENICSALSRYFKQPQIGLESNQYGLLDKIPYRTIIDVIRLCEAELVFTESGITSILTRKSYKYTEIKENGIKLKKFERDSFNLIEFRVDKVGNALCGHNCLTFKSFLDKILSQNTWWFWFILFLRYIIDCFSWVYNIILEYIYSPVYFWYDQVDMLKKFVLLPLPKKALYTSFVYSEIDLIKILDNSEIWESMFKMEWGKVLKAGRLYATGSTAPLAELVAADFIKYIFRQEVSPGMLPMGGTFYTEFNDSQDIAGLTKLFSSLDDLKNGDAKFVFMSDDGFFVMNIAGTMFYLETDISSCDASNGLPIFVILFYMGESLSKLFGNQVARLILQCARETIVANKDCETEFVRLRPKTFFEYSGSKLTTCLNNIASLAISFSIYRELCRVDLAFNENSLADLKYDRSIDPSDRLWSKKSDFDLTKIVATAAHNVGYVLTVEPKKNRNALTFMKHAYGSGTAWTVMGVLLRSLGTRDHIETPQMFSMTQQEFDQQTLLSLTEVILKSAVEGWVNEPSSPLMDALRTRVGLPLSHSRSISYQDLEERYGLQEHEWIHLYDSIVNLQFGDQVFDKCLEKIYHIDYGTIIEYDEGERVRHLHTGADLLF